MKSGHFTTNKKVIKNHLDCEDIKKFNEIRTFQNMTKLTSYEPGYDGRVRTSINMLPQELQQSARSYDPSSSNLTPSSTPPPQSTA